MIVRRTLLRWLTLVCMLIASVTGTVFAEEVPPAPTKNIYVQDYANVIDADTERQMQIYSARLAQRTGAQIVIVTVDTTGQVPIEQYALDILRTWGIGDKEKNNGVLMLVAVKDRKSRIEVGYGLEGALNDAKTGAIQDQYMIPAFRQGQYSQGIWRGYAALFKETAREYQIPIEELSGKSQKQTAQGSNQVELGWFECAIAGIVILLMLIDMKVTGGRFTHVFLRVIMIILSRGRSGGGGFGGGRGGGGGSSRSW